MEFVTLWFKRRKLVYSLDLKFLIFWTNSFLKAGLKTSIKINSPSPALKILTTVFFGWTEPIIKAQFEIQGIVLKGLLGLQYENGEQNIVSGNGFVIPKNTVVRIFNAGEGELILIEVLRPAYKKELVQKIKNFKSKL